MRIVVDIGHPGHVHFFKHFIWDMEKAGHEVSVTAQDKEMTLKLLELYNIPYQKMGQHVKSLGRKFIDMPLLDLKMHRMVKKFKPELFMGIASYRAAQVARMMGAKSYIFDDTEHAKMARRLYKPFATNIMTPSCYWLDIGSKQVRYNGFHELAYLHQNRFKPDPSVLDELGVGKGDKFVIIRFVAWTAGHDAGHKGFTLEDKIKIIKEIEKHAKPLITSEGIIPKELQKHQIRIPPHLIHDALSYSKLYIGEGGTMASEAAVLGVPSIYTNELKLGYTSEEEKIGLVKQFSPNTQNMQKITNEIDRIFESNSNIWEKLRSELLQPKIDVTAFMVWFVENYPESARIMKEEPEYQNKFK